MKKPFAFRNILIFVVAVVLLLAANAGLNKLGAVAPRIYNNYSEIILLHAGIYIILAVSLNLVNGFTGQFSIGHAGLFAIGAYVGAAFTTFGQATFLSHLSHDGQYTPISGGFVLFLSMIVGGAAAALAGWIIGQPSLKLRGDYLAIVTLGFNQIIVTILDTMDVVGGPRGFQELDYKGNSYYIPSLTSFFWVYLVVFIVIALSINLRKSVQGLAFLSVREDEIAAEAVGVPTTRIKVTAFVLSAFFAGVAGSLFAHQETFIKPDQFNFMASINIVVMVVLGGMGSVTGTAIGAFLLTVIPEYLRAIEQYRLVIYSLLLIILMLVRPQGIFGKDELDRRWLAKQVEGLRTLPMRVVSLFTRQSKTSQNNLQKS